MVNIKIFFNDSNPPNQMGQHWELALKKIYDWPYEKPVQTIVTNLRHFLSLVSSHQQNFQTKTKRHAEGNSSSKNMATAENWQKSKDALLESVQIERAILLSRVDELNHLRDLCQIFQSGVDQQQREKEKAKEGENLASKSSSMASNPPNQIGQQWEMALKKLGEWPYEKPAQSIMTNVNSFLSFVSADGSSSNMPTAAGDWQKSKDVLLESVEIEEVILLTRVNELNQLNLVCQMVQSEIDQQKREEENQKAKEVEKPGEAKENTIKSSMASTNGVNVNVDLLEKNKSLESQLEKMELREKALEKKLEEKDKQVSSLLSRVDELKQFKELCKMVKNKIDQQEGGEEEKQKAKEVEKPAAAENITKTNPSAASKLYHKGADAIAKLQGKKPQKQKLVSTENDVEEISATRAVVSSNSNSSNSLVKYRGLYNQGLTCALNSVLQTLFMTPQFRQMIISKASIAKYYKASQNDRLFVELGQLFEHLQYDTGELACSTVEFTKALGWTRKETGQQCDAHVVFRDILTALQDPMSSPSSRSILDIFHSELVNWTRCTECGEDLKQIQTVLSLAVPIQGHNSVEDCLRSFFNNVDEIPGFACQKCDKVVTVKKAWRYSKLAPILAVNLMRFQNNGNRVVKLDNRLSFNTLLDCGQQNIYELYAVINHSGTVDGGHYYAYIRDPPQDQWFRFDDSVVSPLTHQTDHGIQSIAGYRNYELASSSAYILFYKKIGPMTSATDEGTPA